MKQTLLLLALLTLCVDAFSQGHSNPAVVQRGSSAVVNSDARLMASLNLYIPRTVTAPTLPPSQLNGGVDTLGALVYNYGDSSLYTYIGGSQWQRNLNTRDILATSVTSIDSLPGLPALFRLPGSSINVLGYYVRGDQGGGLFYWDDTATSTTYPGLVISVPGVPVGRYKRRIDGNWYNILWVGGVRSANIDIDQTTDNTPQVRSLIKFIASRGFTSNDGFQDYTYGGTIYFPQGSYRFADSINVLTSVVFQGESQKSVILKADFVVGGARPAGSKDFFTCYGGGSGGTGFPPVISGNFGHCEFRDLQITSSLADNYTVNTQHWTMANAIKLRNGYFVLYNLEINSADSCGINAYETIGTDVSLCHVQNNGFCAMYLSQDPKNPLNPSTTTTLFNDAFRTSRRGPGLYITTVLISTSAYNCLFENNGMEDSTKGWGVLCLGDSSQQNFSHNFSQTMSIKMNFYGCDFERNLAGRIMTNYADILLDYGCRYTGQPAVGQPDIWLGNSMFWIDLSHFGPNANPLFGTPSIYIRSKDSARTAGYINMIPRNNLTDLTITDSVGNVHPFTWLRFFRFISTQSNGVGDIEYFGSQMQLNGGYLIAGRDSLMVDSASIKGSTSNSLFLLAGDSLASSGPNNTGKFRVWKYWGGKIVSSLSSTDGSLNFSGPVAGVVQGVVNFTKSNTWTAITTFNPSVQGSTGNNSTTNAVLLTNIATAASGLQAYSPYLQWTGQAWNTTSSASQSVSWRQYVKTIQGATVSGNMTWGASLNGGSYADVTTLSPTGLFASPLVEGQTGLLAGLGGQIGSFSLSVLYGSNSGIGFQRASGGTAQGASIVAQGQSGSGADLAFRVQNSGGTNRNSMLLSGYAGAVLVGKVIDNGDPIDLLQDTLNANIGDTLKVGLAILAPGIGNSTTFADSPVVEHNGYMKLAPPNRYVLAPNTGYTFVYGDHFIDLTKLTTSSTANFNLGSASAAGPNYEVWIRNNGSSSTGTWIFTNTYITPGGTPVSNTSMGTSPTVIHLVGDGTVWQQF